MTTQFSLLKELDHAMAHGTVHRRAEMLERVTDLFVFGAQSHSGEHLALFDDVFLRLVATIEESARATLAGRLAAVPLSPPGISRLLACDGSVEVAGPVLERCGRLENGLLVDCAKSRSQQHLLAISRRRMLDESVTDVLVARGSRPVILSIVGNAGAKFSAAGYTTLVGRSEADDELAICVGLRRDIPRHQLIRLLSKASHVVRVKLEAAEPLTSDALQTAIAEAANVIQTKTRLISRSYVEASALVGSMKAAGRLTEAELQGFAAAEKFEETTAALALLCDLPIEPVERAMVQDRPETILLIAKALELSWTTIKCILRMRSRERIVSANALEHCLETYTRLKPMTARQVLAFHRRRARHG